MASTASPETGSKLPNRRSLAVRTSGARRACTVSGDGGSSGRTACSPSDVKNSWGADCSPTVSCGSSTVVAQGEIACEVNKPRTRVLDKGAWSQCQRLVADLRTCRRCTSRLMSFMNSARSVATPVTCRSKDGRSSTQERRVLEATARW